MEELEFAHRPSTQAPSLSTRWPLGPVTPKITRTPVGSRSPRSQEGSLLVLGTSCWREGQGPGYSLSLAGGYPQVRAEGTLRDGSLVNHTASSHVKSPPLMAS